VGFAFSLIFGLIGLPGLIAGAGLVILGLALLTEWTYCEIAVSRQYLKSIEHFGFCRWSRKQPSAGLTSLSIGRGMGPDSEGDLGSISIDTEDGMGLMVAVGYSMTLLQPIAENLAYLLEQSRIARAFDPKVHNGETDEDEESEGAEDMDDAEVSRSEEQGPSRRLTSTPAGLNAEPVRPADTDITLLPQAKGLAIAVPPSGFKGAAPVLIILGALFSVAAGAALIATGTGSGSPKFGLCLFLGLFLSVGIAMVLGGIHSARQRFMLAVTEEGLALRRISLFRKREQVCSRADIAAIHIGPSNVSVNNVPIMELKIERCGGASTLGALANRSHDEINWIAGLLRQALQVGAEARFDQGGVSDDSVIQPAGSKITVQHQGRAYTFEIPPTGLFKGPALGAFVFSFVWLSIIAVMAVLIVTTHGPLGIVLFLGIFVAIGLAMLAYAIKTGRQRVLLAVSPDLLAYQQTSPFGTSKRHFQRSEIAAIGVGPSSSSSGNDTPIPELKVEILKKGQVGLLQGYSAAELAWLAALLRSTLKVGRIR
jgi:uncharacterized membrane protein